MSIAVAAASPAASADTPIRVMVVDDAVVARSLLRGWIDAEPDMKVVAALRTGRQAVDAIEHHDADVVMLDVDMPELDGISALPLLLKKKRGLVVIMVSTLTRRSAEVSLRALSLGAADYVPKPEAAPDAATSAAFRRELIEKVRTLGRGRAALRAHAPAAVPAADPSLRRAAAAGRRTATRGRHQHRQPAAVLPRRAARAADRLFDRRPAGAFGVACNIDRRDRPRAGVDRAAHAADLYCGLGRAPQGRRRPRRARGRGRRTGPCRRHLRGARRPSHARRARPRRCADRARRRPPHQFLQAGGGRSVLIGGGGMGRRQPRARAHRHGHRRYPRRRGSRRGGRQRDRSGRGDAAWCGACRARLRKPASVRPYCRSIRWPRT